MQTGLQHTANGASQQSDLKRGTGQLIGFFNKFNNDWTMQSAGTLAYNLLVAIVPIILAIIAGFGFTVGALSPATNAQFRASLTNAFQSNKGINLSVILEPVFNSLQKNAGLLAIFALLLAIFGGSRLFIAIEGCFSITYRTYPRKIIAQNVMAILMMILFIILIPLMIFTSSIPTLLTSLARSPLLSNVPLVTQLTQNGLFIGIVSVLVGLLIAWILFEAIFLFVPNQKISLRKSWGGALLSAVLLEAFLALFPLYISHFMGSYTGTAGFAVILLVFFYYFAVILLLGAQVNAYFAEHVSPLPNNLAAVLHDAVKKPE